MHQTITLIPEITLSPLPSLEPAPMLPEQVFLPDAYRLPEGTHRGSVATTSPRVVFIEVTNRCNLLCETCPRTFFTREPIKSLSYAEFIRIAEQFPDMTRALLHGIGEPLLNRELPQMIRYLKARHVEVIFNSNGTLLTPRWQEELVQSGLDQFRCSIDGAEADTYAKIRGADLLHKIKEGLAGLVATKQRLQATTPQISIWCVASKENIHELPDLVRLAAQLGVTEVYLQRMVFFGQESDAQFGMAKRDHAIFGQANDEQEQIILACEALSEELGVAFRASGAGDPMRNLAPSHPNDFRPWTECMRPWTTAYVTANGNCLPCCIAPFAISDYESILLGNLFERPFDEIWNDAPYQQFRSDFFTDQPHKACASCGVYWSL